MTLSKEEVSAAIEAIRNKGWDINPYTVADEINVTRSIIYRDVDFMRLIIEARGGTLGMDVETSLDLAQRLQELERRQSVLDDEVRTLRSQLSAKGVAGADDSFEQPEFTPGTTLEIVPEIVKDSRDITTEGKTKKRSKRGSVEITADLGLIAQDTASPLPEPDLEGAEFPPKPISAFEGFAGQPEACSDFAISEPRYAVGHVQQDPSLIEAAGGENSGIELGSNLESRLPLRLPVDVASAATRERQSITDDYPSLESIGKTSIDTGSSAGPAQTLSEDDTQNETPVFDLDAVDIFLGLNGEGLKDIEVIEDVLLPEHVLGMNVAGMVKLTGNADAAGEMIEAAKSKDSPSEPVAVDKPDEADTVSGEELRRIVKNRIQQAASDQQSQDQPPTAKERDKEKETPKGPNRSKFVGSKTVESPQAGAFVTRIIPPEIRKACLVLGVRSEEITYENVTVSWKQQISSPGVHPDLGGDTESAIYLNTAKDVLIRWLDQQSPKLGKKFGQPTKETNKTAPPQSEKHSKQ